LPQKASATRSLSSTGAVWHIW